MTPEQLAAMLGPLIAREWPVLASLAGYLPSVARIAEQLALDLGPEPPVRVETAEVVVEDRRD